MSRDEGDGWDCIARHLPEIYAVEAAEPAYEIGDGQQLSRRR
jgi:hypothetical protein